MNPIEINKCSEGCSWKYVDKLYEIHCGYIETNHDNTCPCEICLVKSMCHDVCDEWDDWRNERFV